MLSGAGCYLVTALSNVKQYRATHFCLEIDAVDLFESELYISEVSVWPVSVPSILYLQTVKCMIAYSTRVHVEIG